MIEVEEEIVGQKEGKESLSKFALELPIIPDPVEHISLSFNNNDLIVTITPPESKSLIKYYTAYFYSMKQELLETKTFHDTNSIRIKRI